MTGVGGGGGLVKNSVIKCSIDDLEEGLLVVSFTNNENIYQGVLLQLNRERGIPTGISFLSGDKKEPPSNNNPIQPPPLAQRNTYFQETDNGRQYRSLRRVIKTPARFKNSRMSLRPVQRPILCAKCGVLCKDKDKETETGDVAVATTTKSTITTATTPTNKASTKDKLDLTPKVRLSKLSPPINGDNNANNKPIPNNSSNKNILPVVEDPKVDYNYVGIHSVGVVDNAWKRPLSKPLRTYQTRHSLSTSASSSKQIIAKLFKPPEKVTSNKNGNSLSSKINNDEPLQENEKCPIFRITKAPQLKSRDKRKASNLKLCIKKLVMVQEAKIQSKTEQENKTRLKIPEIEKDGRLANSCRHDNNNFLVVPPMKIPIRKKMQKIKLKRRNSTMPYRFKESERIKNSPTWRMRKISTMSEPDDKTISSKDDELSCDEINYETNVGVADSAETDQQLNQVDTPKPSLPPLSVQCDYPLLNSDLSPIQSPEQFDDFSDNEKEEQVHKPEPAAKTPVIKITFGSSGNGVVVQIPSKHTNNNVQKSEDISSESQNHLDAKAVRKALKKARKEAKRKQSEKIITTCTDSSISLPVLKKQSLLPSSDPTTKPALTPLTIHLNSSSSSCAHPFVTSPIISIKTSSSDINLQDSSHHSPILGHYISPEESSNNNANSTIITEELSEFERYEKKKKKAKKRKRQKDHKENHLDSKSSHQNIYSPLLIASTEEVSSITNPVLQISSPSHPKSDVNLSNQIIPMTMNSPISSQSQQPSNNEPVNRSSTVDTSKTNPQRVCISLKRLKNQTNSYIPSWNSSSSGNCFISSGSGDEHGTTSDSAEAENNEDEEEPHDFPDATFFSDVDIDEQSGSGESSSQQPRIIMESVELYNHIQSNHEYKKGDVVWGKSTGCPWWPGKIVDIQLRGVEDARVKIAWYKSATQSFIGFSDLHPFEEYFDTKYIKNRKRGCYQQAVREATIDAHQLNLQDLPMTEK